MDVGAVLERIQFSQHEGTKPSPTLDTLNELHRQFVLNIPFGSLSIHSGEKIKLELPWIYNKLVVEKRDGFCFELNALFQWLIETLGYKTSFVSAHVWRSHNEYAPVASHIAICVHHNIDRCTYLCDVGFGNAFREPLQLRSNTVQDRANGQFKLLQEDGVWYLLSCQQDDSTWQPLYKFTETIRQLSEFREVCEQLQTSPASIFVQKSLCCLHLPYGLLTSVGYRVFETQYKNSMRKTRAEKTLTTKHEVQEVLLERFGIRTLAKFEPRDNEIRMTDGSLEL